jgi:hypothetical protein
VGSLEAQKAERRTPQGRDAQASQKVFVQKTPVVPGIKGVVHEAQKESSRPPGAVSPA